MAVVVRRARLEDAQIIAEFAFKLIVQHVNYNAERFSQIADLVQMANYYGGQTKAKDAAVLVAENDGEIVGFAYVQFEEKNYAELLEKAAWLHDIYVEESARSRNAGKLLIESAIKTAKELGAEKLMLSAASQNEHAQKFFKRHGFAETMIEMMLDLTE